MYTNGHNNIVAYTSVVCLPKTYYWNSTDAKNNGELLLVFFFMNLCKVYTGRHSALLEQTRLPFYRMTPK